MILPIPRRCGCGRPIPPGLIPELVRVLEHEGFVGIDEASLCLGTFDCCTRTLLAWGARDEVGLFTRDVVYNRHGRQELWGVRGESE